MTDRRESILQRLHAVAKTVHSSVERMDLNIEIGDTPSLVLLDGDEDFLGEVGKHEVQAPGPMLMKPHFSLILQASDRAGTLLSELRTKLVKAVLADEQLRQLTGVFHGRHPVGAQYIGCETTVHIGEATIAEMVMHFSIVYRFNPSNL